MTLRTLADYQTACKGLFDTGPREVWFRGQSAVGLPSRPGLYREGEQVLSGTGWAIRTEFGRTTTSVYPSRGEAGED